MTINNETWAWYETRHPLRGVYFIYTHNIIL